MENEFDFDSLFNNHYARAVRFAYFITNDIALADDIVQEAFLIVYNKYHTLKEKEKFKFWLNTIIINCANAAFKKNSRYYPTENIESILSYTKDERDGDPADILEDKEQKEIILSGISSLEDIERQVFVLRYYEDYSFKEIAQTLNINENTARSIIYRGKKILAQNLSYFDNSLNVKVRNING